MKDEMDILREVSSIAAGHGSIALSEMMGRKLDLDLPSLEMVPAASVTNKIQADLIVLSVACNILSGIKGEIIFVLDEKSAFKLIDLCYRARPEDKKSGLFTEMGLSLIKEVGNIIISSYVGALSMILKTVVIPSTPTLVSGSLQQVLSMAVSPFSSSSMILLVEAVFIEPQEKITGKFYLVLNAETIQTIQDSCKKILEGLQ
ncbi:MAG TPA: chemotaxis protein CheC [Candidatus Omnitrophota bacterium]|nr:chemotaxis protein CheC [Candidatus Omnitrophota bacterium]